MVASIMTPLPPRQLVIGSSKQPRHDINYFCQNSSLFTTQNFITISSFKLKKIITATSGRLALVPLEKTWLTLFSTFDST